MVVAEIKAYFLLLASDNMVMSKITLNLTKIRCFRREYLIFDGTSRWKLTIFLYERDFHLLLL